MEGENMNNLKIGSFLQALRKAKGLTQAELADYFEISAKTISKWECGDSLPEIPMLKALAEYYDVTVDEILNGERGVKKEEDKNKSKNEKYFMDRKFKKLNLVMLLAFSVLAFGFLLLLAIGFTTRTDIAFWVSVAFDFVSCLIVFFGLYMIGEIDDEFSESNIKLFKNKRFWYCYFYLGLLVASILMSFFFYYIPSSTTHMLNAHLSLLSTILLFLLILCFTAIAFGIYPFIKYCSMKTKKLVFYLVYSVLVLLLLLYLGFALLGGEIYYQTGTHFKNFNLLNGAFNAMTWTGYGFLVLSFIVTLVLTVFRKYHIVGYGISILAFLLLICGINGSLPKSDYISGSVYYILGSVFQGTVCFCIIFAVLLIIEGVVRLTLYIRKRKKSLEN